MAKYIFIDLGAYNGDSIRAFMRKRKLPARPTEFEIYAFEPNPVMWLDLINLPYSNIVVSNKAAWIEDGVFPFALDTNALAYGSTLMESKRSIWDKFAKMDIECFNFPKWVEQFKDDYVIVKMDIEGAEFPILHKMLAEGTIGLIDQLWVETHPNKVEDYTTLDSKKLFKNMREYIYVEEWH